MPEYTYVVTVDADNQKHADMIMEGRSAPLFEWRPAGNRHTSEIGDGTVVAWDMCSRCGQHTSRCSCADGPQEPGYIAKWRREWIAEKKNAATKAATLKAEHERVLARRTIGGTEGQDRESYTDTQDRDSYTVDDVDDGLNAAIAAVRSEKTEETPDD